MEGGGAVGGSRIPTPTGAAKLDARQLQPHVDGSNGGSERWSVALANLSEMGSGLDSLQQLLLRQAVYMDEEAFSHTSANANHARHALAQERRIRSLEKELDAAIATAGLARAEKRLAEAAQRAAEVRTQEVLQELENTTQVFKLHMEELRARQVELQKKNEEINVLQAIIETLSQGSSQKPQISFHKSKDP